MLRWSSGALRLPSRSTSWLHDVRIIRQLRTNPPSRSAHSGNHACRFPARQGNSFGLSSILFASAIFEPAAWKRSAQSAQRSCESGCWSRRILRSLFRAKGRTSGYADPPLFPLPRPTRPLLMNIHDVHNATTGGLRPGPLVSSAMDRPTGLEPRQARIPKTTSGGGLGSAGEG